MIRSIYRNISINTNEDVKNLTHPGLTQRPGAGVAAGSF